VERHVPLAQAAVLEQSRTLAGAARFAAVRTGLESVRADRIVVVVARAKAGTRAAENYHADVVVLFGGVEELDQLVEVLEAERVVLLRPVEHEVCHWTDLLQADVLGHGHLARRRTADEKTLYNLGQ
jgi:hypothetical protein